MLEYPGGPDLINHMVLKSEEHFLVVVIGECDYKSVVRDAVLLALEMEEVGHRSRNVGDF